jgi:hypothetical protein
VGETWVSEKLAFFGVLVKVHWTVLITQEKKDEQVVRFSLHLWLVFFLSYDVCPGEAH